MQCMLSTVLMSFYCASGALIAAIFNLIYASLVSECGGPSTIDFSIKPDSPR